MNPHEERLRGELLSCPHCGKAPHVHAMREGDPRLGYDAALDWHAELDVGETVYRITCCACMEGLPWAGVKKIWNRRDG